jgi:hypothetical protein
MDNNQLRKKWRAYNNEHDRQFKAWEATGFDYLSPRLPPFPPELVGLTCGAKTRAGTPCKQKGIYINGRCKLHGGLSTGPTTEEGKKKAAANGFKPKKKRSP